MAMRVLLGVSILATLLGCGLLKRSVEERVRAALIAQAPGVSVSRGDDADSLVAALPDGRSVRLHLDTLKRHCSASPRDCDASIEAYVRRALAPAPELERDGVSVTVKPAAYIDAAAQQASALFTQPFVGELNLVLVQDLGDALGFLTLAELTEAKLSGEDLATQGIVRETARCATIDTEPAGGPLLHLDDDDPLPCLLVPGYWSALATKSNVSELLVGAPSQGIVLVLPGSDPAGRAALEARTRAIYANAVRPLSRALYRWSAGSWSVAQE